MSTDDFLPKNDVNEFEFDFFDSVSSESKSDNECSFAHDVRRLKRELKESKIQLKKVREENNRLHSKLSKQREIIDKYRKNSGITTQQTRPVYQTGQNTMPGMITQPQPQPQVVYPGYSALSQPVIVNDLNRPGFPFTFH